MKIIEILVKDPQADAVFESAAESSAVDRWQGPAQPDGRRSIRLLVPRQRVQETLDRFQGLLSDEGDIRLLVHPLDVSLPREPEGADEPSPLPEATTREELYNTVEQGTRLDSNFFLLVLLSTVVAAIGLLEDNTAVVIGAMVIAPLLGPNLALALATALGDRRLLGQSLAANVSGLAIALMVSLAIGLGWPTETVSHELMIRTEVGWSSVALALASGAAAVLSLTTGLPTVLVGVMVAVALLPPTAALGLMAGSGQWGQAEGAGILLAVNIVCINLAAKLVFLARGVKPHAWFEQRRARQSTTAYVLFWVLSLAALLAVIYLR